MNSFFLIIQRDLRLAMRQANDSAITIAFFMTVIALFPLAIGPETNLLERISAGIIWVAALLSALLSLERLFLADYEDGSLELLALSPSPLSLIVLGKITTHWLTTGLPLIIVTPLFALLLHLDMKGFITLIISMIIGTPTLSLIGGLGAALSLGARRGGVLISLLILPLAIPVLIFGSGAVDQSIQGMSPYPQLLLMSGLFLITLSLAPWAASSALRQILE
jgi:heme exporter protein B